MSMSATWVQCNDALYYREPRYGDDATWFVCFDDDDPPEVVVRMEKGETRDSVMARTAAILDDAGFHAEIVGRGRINGKRHFNGRMVDAFSAWIDIRNAPPPPAAGKGHMSPGMGVVYRW